MRNVIFVILTLTLSEAKGKGKDLFIVEILRPEPALSETNADSE